MNTFTALAGWGKTDRLTPLRVKKLCAFFGDLVNAWEKASESTFRVIGFSEKERASILDDIKNTNAEKEAEILQKLGVDILTPASELYPSRLKETVGRPEILYMKGMIHPEDAQAFAVVGSRKVSPYGKQAVSEIVRPLAKHFTLVSGLAVGIDALSHEAALEMEGRTIAVLGNGIDWVYPSQNRSLADRILLSGGVIFSEFAPGVQAEPYNFPRRNRVVSGMSVGTLVVEAQKKSGSLITAELALEQGRDVFAIPGSVFSSYSSGCNALVSKGEAKLVTSVEDILIEYDLEKMSDEQAFRHQKPSNTFEESICSFLSKEPIAVGDLQKETNIPLSDLNVHLTMLEMKGMAKNMGTNRWVQG